MRLLRIAVVEAKNLPLADRFAKHFCRLDVVVRRTVVAETLMLAKAPDLARSSDSLPRRLGSRGGALRKLQRVLAQKMAAEALWRTVAM